MIAGFIDPTEGEIALNGQVISSGGGRSVPPELRNIGMVFQSYAVWPHMSVRQNIELPLRLRKLSRKEITNRCDEALNLCRLAGLADREPHQLSGGQLQRVALARALAYRPSVILLDEPLSNLDVSLREELRRELHDLHRAMNATFVLVTHDQVEAMSLSDRVVVMREGRIEQVGSPLEIYRSPASEFVAQFVGSANILHGVVESVNSAGSVIRCGSMEMRIDRTDIASGKQVSLAIHPEAIAVGGDPETQSSDNVFSAKVVAAYFLGRVHEIVVEIDGQFLRMTQLRHEPVSKGQIVSVRIRAASVVVLPEPSSPPVRKVQRRESVPVDLGHWPAGAPH